MEKEIEIEKTLSSLDNLIKAKAPDSFYDELEKRMSERTIIIPMPLLKIAATIILVLNLSIFFRTQIVELSFNNSAVELNDDYFNNYSIDFESYIEIAENEGY
ncbi:hypothetical protein HZR84_00620 [Hyphobacterium sp. CCMP332]|nr:hypothetical protein HZR84_00620 [Hyphobacterium sp. CCMP332]